MADFALSGSGHVSRGARNNRHVTHTRYGRESAQSRERATRLTRRTSRVELVMLGATRPDRDDQPVLDPTTLFWAAPAACLARSRPSRSLTRPAVAAAAAAAANRIELLLLLSCVRPGEGKDC